MDPRSAKDEDAEVDLESGLTLTVDDPQNISIPCTAKQVTTLFAKIYCGLVKDSVTGEDEHIVCRNETNLSGVSMDVVKATNKSSARQGPVDCAGKSTSLKEKRKKSGNKKAPKPPRPPRAPSLDAADLKLMREISELAMLRRARIERMKALKKMKSSKQSSSSSSSMLAMIFTVVFCIVIILQGMSPGKSSVASFKGSPGPAGKPEAGLIAVQHHLNPSSSVPNAPVLDSHNLVVQQVIGSDSPVKLTRDAHK